MNERNRDNGTVILNVGGSIHQVKWETIDKFPKSRLQKLRYATSESKLEITVFIETISKNNIFQLKSSLYVTLSHLKIVNSSLTVLQEFLRTSLACTEKESSTLQKVFVQEIS